MFPNENARYSMELSYERFFFIYKDEQQIDAVFRLIIMSIKPSYLNFGLIKYSKRNQMDYYSMYYRGHFFNYFYHG